MDTVSLLYRGALYVEVILYSKECNWYTRCCLLNGGVHVHYRVSIERLYISNSCYLPYMLKILSNLMHHILRIHYYRDTRLWLVVEALN